MKTIRDEHFGPEYRGSWHQGAVVLCLAGLVGCGGSSTVTDAGTDTHTVMDVVIGDTGPTPMDAGVDNGPPPSDVPIVTDVPTDTTPLTMPGGPTQFAGGPSFVRPLDVVLTANGTSAYFIAFDPTSGTAEIFRSMGGTTSVIPTSTSLDTPLSLAISADDSTIYIADIAANAGTAASTAGFGAIFSIGGEGGTPTAVSIGAGINFPRAIAIGGATGAESLTFIATDAMGAGVFRVSTAGGTATRLDTAGTLVDPAALTVASDGSVYVLDSRGSAALYHIASAGGAPTALPTAGAIVGLTMRFPAGIALSLDEHSLFVSAWDPGNGSGLLTWLNVDGSSPTSPAVYAPSALTGLVSPCGLHRAHSAEIFGVADELSTGTGAILSLH